MLSIILLILKIIGIALLVIIGLVLLILLTVLIVPIRYRVLAEHGDEKLYIVARVSWLLHIIRVNASFIEGELHLRMKVLWITLYDNLNPKVKKSGSKSRKKSRKKKAMPISKRGSVPNGQSVDVARNNNPKEITNPNLGDYNTSTPKLMEPKSILTEPMAWESDQDIDQNQIEEKEKVEKKSIFNKISDFFLTIKNKFIAIKQRIVALFKGIKAKIIKWYHKIKDITHKVNLIIDFLKDELNKEGFRITFTTVKKLLKHILPTKLKSKIVFGTGDPCSTGQALGAIGFLYSLYGDKVQIIPDFENKVFEGKHDARGRIRLITVLILVIKLILDKRFKQLKNNFQILKEAL